MSPEEARMLKQQVATLTKQVEQLIHADRYHFARPLSGEPNGLRLAIAATDKLGFFGKTPIKQPSSTGTTSSMTTVGGTAVTESNGFDGATGTKFYTIGDIVKHLKNLGLLAS